ncbi:MAG: hypothetical protein KDD54_00585 [Flavobacteriales bacterium]|nr:hypothetical protein [Flavobacteriales bacterium]
MYDYKAIFFVDTIYLVRLREISTSYPKAMKDWQSISEQLQDMRARGHRIYYHFHPHWIQAAYLPDINMWDASNHGRFTFDRLTDEEKEYVVAASESVLKEILGKTHVANGYRAGGLYLQPFRGIKPYLDRLDVTYDFSVLREFESKADHYGFRYDHPPLKPMYTFEADEQLEDASGGFVEVPLDALHAGIGWKLLNSLWYRTVQKMMDNQRFGDGTSSGNVIRPISSSGRYTLRETYSIELMNHVKSVLYLKRARESKLLHFISHPKLISEQNIKAFHSFAAMLRKRCDVVTDLEYIRSVLMPRRNAKA